MLWGVSSSGFLSNAVDVERPSDAMSSLIASLILFSHNQACPAFCLGPEEGLLKMPFAGENTNAEVSASISWIEHKGFIANRFTLC